LAVASTDCGGNRCLGEVSVDGPINAAAENEIANFNFKTAAILLSSQQSFLARDL
jgi:hypothetical protein